MPGRPAEAVTSTMVAHVEGFVNKDRRVTLQEVFNQFCIGKASAYQLLHENMYEDGKCSAGAKATDRRPKGILVDMAKEYLGRFNHGKNKFFFFFFFFFFW